MVLCQPHSKPSAGGDDVNIVPGYLPDDVPHLGLRNMIEVPDNCPDGWKFDPNIGRCREVIVDN